MRSTFTIFICLIWVVFAWAQPANDDCVNAESISMGVVPDCPAAGSVTGTASGTTIDATPTSPYPAFTDCPSGSFTTGPANEVWYTFVPSGNSLDINLINTFDAANITLFIGDDCMFLNAVNCWSFNTGNVNITSQFVQPGQTYYLLISGGDVLDDGTFTLTLTNYNDCTSCISNSPILTVAPPPTNSTYSTGAVVTFCYTIVDWDVTQSFEWLHSVVVDFGAGWDYPDSFNPIPPPSCDGQGVWGWYDSWTSSETGQTFGPGFAYDSSLGGPFDGNPGNNWGDGGNGCATITELNPVTFCFSIAVRDDANCVGGSSGDLSINLTPYSDGDSGSWTGGGCLSGVPSDNVATAICCEDLDPNTSSTPTSCPGVDDGTLTVEGQTIDGSLGTFNYVVFDLAGNIIFQQDGVLGPLTVTGLAPGTYVVQATNAATGCPKPSLPVVIDEGTPPDAIASQLPACLGDPITLTGDVIPGDPNATYEWTGPDGTLFGQTVVVNTPGAWTLVVTSNGCPSNPVTINVTAEEITTSASADPLAVCENQQPVTLTAQGDPTFIYDWGIYGIGQTIVIPSLSTTTTFTVTVTNPVSGCSAEAEVTVNVNPLPPVNIIDPGPVCQGVPIILEATGAVTYVWEDGQTGPIGAFTFDQQGPTSITVVGTDAFGCVASFTLNIFVVAPPDGAITPGVANICEGEDITLTASGGINYAWSTGQGSASITVSPSNTFPYTVTITDVNGCTDVQTLTVDVDNPVIPPTIICLEETSSSVIFSWDDVAGAYDIVVLTGQTGILNGTTFTVDNLSPGEEVTIELTAVSGSACPDQTVTATCSAEDCPMVDIILTSPQNDICLEAISVPFNLSAQIVGGQGSGTGVWSGTGIIDANTGTFDPSVAMEGAHEIVFNYAEAGPCEYSDTITINVFDIPTADFTIDPANICVDGDSTTVIYTGDADVNNATFNWTFNGGDANPASGPGPLTIGWPVAGLRTITLTVIENGCTSTTVSQNVEVEAPLEVPVIQCGTTTTTSVEFTWADIAGAVGYTVNVISGQTGTLDSTSYTVNNLNPGEIVTIEVTAEGDGACGNSSAQFSCEALPCPNFVVDINVPQNDICLDGMAAPFDLTATVNGGVGNGLATWSGTGITDANMGTFDPSVAMEGAHLITFAYTEGPCDVTETVTVNVFDVPTADFSVSPNVECINEDITVEYIGDANLSIATFNWNFSGGNASATSGPGPITVSWPTGGMPTVTLSVSENGCTASSSQDVTIEEPLAAPVINCNSTPSSITFTWNDVIGASSYTVSVLQGASGTQNGNSYEVTGLNPGDVVEIQVEAVGTGPCGSSFASSECVAENCPNVIIDLPTVNPICLDAFATIVDLDATLMGDDGTGTEAWAGPGIIDAVLGIFDPTVAMVGNHVISYTYQQGNCTYNSSLTIIVNPQPTADFTVVSPICLDGTSTITFSGSAGAMATYDWNFDDGIIVSGMGAGPYEISFPAPGTKTISLRVTDNNCESEEFTQTIQVEEPLPAPIISCNATNTSITFTWDDIAGANGFDVVQIFGEAGTVNGNNYEITGLVPGDSARIRVIALDDGPCDNVAAELTCFAQDCPDIIVTIDSVNALCSNEGLQTLTASASAGMGTFTWSGTGITDVDAGIFDPSIVIDGTVSISVLYTDGVCTYTETIDITVNKQPTADFTVVSPVCTDQNSNIVYTGTGGPAATYDWNFDGGTIVSGMDSGPYNISWQDGGTKTISLTVTEDGCPSEAFTQTLEVEEPLPTPTISCNSDNTSITFSWDDIPGAQGFDVELVFGQTGIINGNTYEVTGLAPSDSVRIRVIALDDGPCGNTQSVLTCYAEDCPDISVNIDPVADLCQDAGLQTLSASASAGMGTFTWSGPGIVNANAGTFDPTIFVGTETITATYTNGVCTYTNTLDITVFEVPTADFTIADMVVCTGQTTEINYLGTGDLGATYDWNFEGGNATSVGTVQGPYEVSWDSPGLKTITLQVTEDGCLSDIFSLMVEVQQPLDIPVISCDTDNTSITFSWDDVDGAEGFEVNVLSGQVGTINGNTFTITNMTPGESATIEVVALDSGPCGNVSSEITCIAADCPDRLVEIADPGALCADDDPITLTATIDGMAGTGTYVFTGPGVVDGVAGTFNPALVAGNTVTITATYTEDVCTYTASIQITVNAVPTATFVATSPICVDDVSTVEFTGVASVDATYEWDFDDGIGGTGAGPFDVSWTDAGTKTITLTVIDNDCVSETITQTVEVDPILANPIINCNTASTSIEFVWNDIAGATGYDVVVTSGQTGTLNGTTFVVDNLIPGEEVEIIVTAIGDGACGNSSATATCIAQECPAFDATMIITESICLGISNNPTITFTFDTSSDGPFMVDYLNETTAVQNSITVSNGETITLTDITETSTIVFISYSDVTLEDCIYPGNQTEVITVSTPVDAGTADQPSQLCVGTAETINLADLVLNGDLGGQWSETSTIPSTGGAFNAANGTLNTGNLPAGAYTFEYLLDAAAPCEDQSVVVEVIVEEEPVADAGENMTLTCNMGMLNIGGSNTSSGAGITYQWTANDPTIIITNPDIAFPEVSQPGIYTLTVSNELGCFATDVVEVSANFDVPVAEIAISDISCFEANDGAITISNVSGGAGGYQYALNGGPFTTTPQFGNLGANDYSLVIQDANGCFSELMVSLTQPEEVVVTLSTNLGPDNIISLGDSVRLEAIFDPSLNVDTLIWQPDSIAKGSSPVVFVNPTTATNYSVTIIDENGCSDTDDMMVLVRIERPVYIPNVFSPNEDGFNDIFYIQGGDFIKQVKTFEVFNRWGESIMALYNFQPNDASFGWDGTYRGKPVNPAVYVWYAEIEFEDGEVILYKGDVAVMK